MAFALRMEMSDSVFLRIQVTMARVLDTCLTTQSPVRILELACEYNQSLRIAPSRGVTLL